MNNITKILKLEVLFILAPKYFLSMLLKWKWTSEDGCYNAQIPYSVS